MLRDWTRVAAVCLLFSACDSGVQEAVPTSMVRDSAGIRVVTHAAPPAPVLELGSAPSVSLGTDPEELTLHEVAGGALLEGGDFLVADAGNMRVLRFSADGELMGIQGGEGQGPGEFRNISWMQRVEGGWAAYDSRARRVTRFDLDGAVIATIPFRPEMPEVPSDDAIRTSGAVLGVTESGSLVGYSASFADPVGEEGPMPLFADLNVYDSTSSVTDSIGRFTLMEWYEDPTADFPVANRLEAGRIWWAAAGDWIAVTNTSAFGIDVFEAGRHSAIIRERAQRVPFTPDSLPEMYHSAADSLPAYRDVRLDSERRVWVKPATAEGELNTVWRVFEMDGSGVGSMSLPTDAKVLDAYGSFILLLRFDEFDAERVEIWPLTFGNE